MTPNDVQVEAAARAIYAADPITKAMDAPTFASTTGMVGSASVLTPVAWDGAPERHDICRKQARAALATSADAGEVVALSAYEAQVLIGTTISGCNMSPDMTFDLKAAWANLYKLGLIDRTDGLAIATPSGGALVKAMLSVLPPPEQAMAERVERLREAEREALEPCPFCGAEPEHNMYFAWCTGPENDPHGPVNLGLENWNRRYPPTRREKEKS